MFKDGLIYQESRMSTEEEFREDLAPLDIYDENADGQGGPVLAYEDGIAYTDPGEGHSMIVGDTGSGKTQKFILPLINSCACASESMFVIDPKGELMRRTEWDLKQRGYRVYGVNFRKPELSKDRWNPLGRIEYMYAHNEEKAAQVLQNDLIQRLFNARSTADKDKFWNESAGNLAEGSLELSHILGERLTIKNMLKWRYERIPDGTMEACFHKLPRDGVAYHKLAGFFGLTAENTKTCILSTYDQLVTLFNSSDALTDMLSESSFELETAATEKTAIFVIVPDEKTTYHFMATLFTNQLYEALINIAEDYNGRLPVRMNFIMEEFCNMPKLDEIGPMLTAARSRNIRFHIVCQSYSQLLERYGDLMGKTLIDNCSNLIYLHSRELDFLEYISRLAGVNEFGRPLLSTSRLQRLKKNETVIFHDRCYPYIVKDLPNMYEYPVYDKYMSDAALGELEKSSKILKSSAKSARNRKKKAG